MASIRKALFVVGLLAAVFLAQNPRAIAAELAVAISLDIPPYVMAQGDKGLESELLRAALPERTLRFLPMPYAEVEAAVPVKADIAVAVRENRDGVFYSREFLSFVNDAITKKTSGLKIDKVADLKDHRVLTWEGADRELGGEFAALFAPQSPQRTNYVAVADQSQQVRMFWQADADVIVIDRAIFAWVSEEMRHSLQEVDVHSIFPAVTRFKVGFRDAALRDEFDRGLAKICASGEYAEVMKGYHVELPSTVCEGN